MIRDLALIFLLVLFVLLIAPLVFKSGRKIAHDAEEEWLIVLVGRPTLRTPDGERELEPAVAGRLGRVPAPELPAVYRATHGCLQPSLYEPFAITVAEALASGLPVIASAEFIRESLSSGHSNAMRPPIRSC